MDLYDELIQKQKLDAKAKDKTEADPTASRQAEPEKQKRPSPEDDAKRPMPRPTYTAPGLGPSGPGVYTNSRVWRPTPSSEPVPEPQKAIENEVQQEPARDLQADFVTKADELEDLYDTFTAQTRQHSANETSNTPAREAFANDAKKLEDLYDSIISQGNSTPGKPKEDELERQRQGDRGR